MIEVWLMLAAVAAAFAAIGWLCRGISARESYHRGFMDGQRALADEIQRQFLREIAKSPKDSHDSR